MLKLLKKLRLYGSSKRIVFYLINHFLVGTGRWGSSVKRYLMLLIGMKVGKRTTIVGPIHIFGSVEIGEDCWINRNFTVHGNGHVIIGDQCDIGPEVSFLTGGHLISETGRRAGKGESYTIQVEKGCWIGSRATLLGNIVVHEYSVVGACALVIKNVTQNTLVGGVPAKTIKDLK